MTEPVEPKPKRRKRDKSPASWMAAIVAAAAVIAPQLPEKYQGWVTMAIGLAGALGIKAASKEGPKSEE